MKTPFFGIILTVFITTKTSTNPLIDAIKSRNLSHIQFFSNTKKFIMTPDQRGATPLHWAAAYGPAELVSAILRKGAIVSSVTLDNETPLHWAVWYRQEQIAELLLKHRADPDARANDGWTPLHNAVAREFVSIAHLLITWGANKHLKDGRGRTPVHLTSKMNVIDEIMLFRPVRKRRPSLTSRIHLPATKAAKPLRHRSPLCYPWDMKAHGESPSAHNDAKWTPLHLEAVLGNLPDIEEPVLDYVALPDTDDGYLPSSPSNWDLKNYLSPEESR